MTDQKKQKEIAVAFAVWYFLADEYDDTHKAYDAWILTEEGKRLTAEEPTPGNEEEVKWLRATMETQFEAYEALAKETAQDIKAMKAQFDRFEGRSMGNLSGE